MNKKLLENVARLNEGKLEMTDGRQNCAVVTLVLPM
jgi:hypothetical protein